MIRDPNTEADKDFLLDKINKKVNKLTKNIELDLDEALENSYVENMLDISDDNMGKYDNESIDNPFQEKSLVGEKAVTDYYQHFKGLDKAVNQNEAIKQEPSVYTSM